MKYVIKLQKKHHPGTFFVNRHSISSSEVVKENDWMEDFLLDKKDMERLYKDIISRTGLDTSNYGSLELSWISISRYSHYKPYAPVEVLNYREFK